MALIEELNQQGNKLFKYRSNLPVPFAVLGLAIYLYNIHVMDKEIHSIAFEIGCLTVGLLGQLIRAVTLGYAPKGTSGRNTHGQVAEELNTKGMYSLMRNPLYLGNFFMWLAIILFIDVHWFSIVNSLLIVLFLTMMVAMIMMRTLYRDLQRYNRIPTDEEKAEEQEESGWKLVHADVFEHRQLRCYFPSWLVLVYNVSVLQWVY